VQGKGNIKEQACQHFLIEHFPQSRARVWGRDAQGQGVAPQATNQPGNTYVAPAVATSSLCQESPALCSITYLSTTVRLVPSGGCIQQAHGIKYVTAVASMDQGGVRGTATCPG
jgi:hypothetical protein